MKTHLRNAEWKNAEWLELRYVFEGKSIREIAKSCGVESRTIAYWLKKFDISTRTISESMEGRRHSKETREKMSRAKLK